MWRKSISKCLQEISKMETVFYVCSFFSLGSPRNYFMLVLQETKSKCFNQLSFMLTLKTDTWLVWGDIWRNSDFLCRMFYFKIIYIYKKRNDNLSLWLLEMCVFFVYFFWQVVISYLLDNVMVDFTKLTIFV